MDYRKKESIQNAIKKVKVSYIHILLLNNNNNNKLSYIIIFIYYESLLAGSFPIFLRKASLQS